MKTKLTFFFLLLCFIVNAQSPQVQELGKLYMSGEYDQAIKKANEYLKSDPENLDYKLILGRALTDIGKYKEAMPHLQFAVDRDNSWRKAWGLSYLGICNYMLSDFEKSESALQSCINLNATKNATNFAAARIGIFGYDSFYSNWTIIESENIRFHFQNMNEQQMKLYVESRESAFEEINTFFESSLPKKIDFFVWDSRDDAKRILHADLGFSRPSYCIIHSYFQQTKGHELTHVLSHYTSAISEKTRFINEGAAVCFDLEQSNHYKLNKVKDWIRKNDTQIEIKDIWINGGEYAEEIVYPLSGLFVQELIAQFGKEKFLEFFANQTYENAQLVYGMELSMFIKEFENKINT
ncbi:tetratricopeptide repeat protein [Maribellus sediminis]|uniref:tetratricopeptide repeat protein n=1 Tax=Maribellus sediminis TaxID=2696285 RepID=UPI00143046A7|nr:tetratricopeptide repeat protein [Maribellus sediminis]